jgi:hypothetical protein
MHSKEPWSYGITDYDNEIVVAGGVPIAEIISLDCAREEFQANCDLIIAAPDLLKAGEEVIATWTRGDLAAAVRKLDAAIAKARGRQ